MAWKRGVKSLYYCRSLSLARADTVSEKAIRIESATPANDGDAPLPMVAQSAEPTNYEECLSCQ